VYLDSAILVKLVVREPESDFFADIVEGQHGMQSSELALVECHAALARKRQHRLIDARTCAAAWNQIQTLWFQAGGVSLQPVTRAILLEAGELADKCVGRVPLRSLDAIHLATCLRVRAFPLVTNDAVMRVAAHALGVPLCPLPA
jgi:predicted nucleic acid-binding protein